MSATNIHATGLVLDGMGLILRGPSGAGKSLLALALIDRWGDAARLVADDRVDLVAAGDGLVMRAPATIAGLIELRGRGVVSRPHVAEAPLHLVVDLVPALERMPEPEQFETRLLGVALARCPVPRAGVIGVEHQVLLVGEAVRALRPALAPRQNTP